MHVSKYFSTQVSSGGISISSRDTPITCRIGPCAKGVNSYKTTKRRCSRDFCDITESLWSIFPRLYPAIAVKCEEESRPDKGAEGKGRDGRRTSKIPRQQNRSICTDERSSDTNQLKTIKNLKGQGRRTADPADWIGGPDRDRSCSRSESPLLRVVDSNYCDYY